MLNICSLIVATLNLAGVAPVIAPWRLVDSIDLPDFPNAMSYSAESIYVLRDLKDSQLDLYSDPGSMVVKFVDTKWIGVWSSEESHAFGGYDDNGNLVLSNRDYKTFATVESDGSLQYLGSHTPRTILYGNLALYSLESHYVVNGLVNGNYVFESIDERIGDHVTLSAKGAIARLKFLGPGRVRDPQFAIHVRILDTEIGEYRLRYTFKPTIRGEAIRDHWYWPEVIPKVQFIGETKLVFCAAVTSPSQIATLFGVPLLGNADSQNEGVVFYSIDIVTGKTNLIAVFCGFFPGVELSSTFSGFNDKHLAIAWHDKVYIFKHA